MYMDKRVSGIIAEAGLIFAGNVPVLFAEGEETPG